MKDQVNRWTPGPWEVGTDDTNGQAIVRNQHIEVATCWHHCVGSIEKEMRANAHLIAAAPELYEALELLAAWGPPCCLSVDEARTFNADHEKARAVLAKARGAQ